MIGFKKKFRNSAIDTILSYFDINDKINLSTKLMNKQYFIVFQQYLLCHSIRETIDSQNLDIYPYNLIGQIEVISNGHYFIGTGIILDKNYVLTSNKLFSNSNSIKEIIFSNKLKKYYAQKYYSINNYSTDALLDMVNWLGNGLEKNIKKLFKQLLSINCNFALCKFETNFEVTEQDIQRIKDIFFSGVKRLNIKNNVYHEVKIISIYDCCNSLTQNNTNICNENDSNISNEISIYSNKITYYVKLKTFCKIKDDMHYIKLHLNESDSFLIGSPVFLNKNGELIFIGIYTQEFNYDLKKNFLNEYQLDEDKYINLRFVYLFSLDILKMNGENKKEKDLEKSFIDVIEKFKSVKTISLKMKESINFDKNVFLSFIYLPNLKELTIENNCLKTKGAELIANALKYLYNLKRLNLGENNLNNIDIKRISMSFFYLSNLEDLILYKNCISDEGAIYMSQTLHNLTDLRTLDLSLNNIGKKGAIYLSKTFKFIKKLEELNLEENFSVFYIGIKNISNNFHLIPNLRKLCLNKTIIMDEGMIVLSENIDKLINLNYIYLRGNKISEKGINRFCLKIKCLKNLLLFDIGDNKIGDQGMKSLTSSFKFLTDLKLIDISKNNIRNSGSELFSQSLKNLINLHVIDMRYNKIDSKEKNILMKNLPNTFCNILI